MRPLIMLGQIVTAAVAIIVAVWWIATLCMRLVLRRLERLWPLHGGPRNACVALLGVVSLLVAAGTLVATWLLYLALRPDPENWSPTTAAIWEWSLIVPLVFGTIAAIVGTFSQTSAAWGALLRQRHLLDLSGPAEPATPPGEVGGRSIVICCDGTGNRPDQEEEGSPATTNVWKLYYTLVCDETQVTWYQAGVGSDTSSTARQARRTHKVLEAVGTDTGAKVAAFGSRLLKLFEGAFGAGVSEGIIRGYTEIVRQYRPGDRIYLVGFSRGAFTARCIAGVISRCGLLRAENIRYAPEVVQLYRIRDKPGDALALRHDMMHRDVRVEFLGVFDTVASLGVPLWGWWFRVFPIWRNIPFATDPAAVCRFVYHALAMDERRSQFFPTLFDPPLAPADTVVQQVWFRGAHGDIGGGYATTGLSDIPLGWMMDAMERHGLVFRQDARQNMRPDPLARIHDELTRNPSWKLFGSWPRWHPLPGDSTGPHGSYLHDAVVARAEIMHQRLGRPDILRLAPGESRDFVTQAHREWDRTGFAIEAGAAYRLTYVGGLWRDAENDACGPDGQRAVGGDIRRFAGRGLRLRTEPWMRLVATVAHPRRWALLEREWRLLVKFLFVSDPEELTGQLAPIGRDLHAPGDAVILRNEAHGGLLYLFANDWWQTASNNSGGIRLRIERLRETDPATPAWLLQFRPGDSQAAVWTAPAAAGGGATAP